MDIGTHSIKAGFGGSPKPVCHFRSVVGRPRHQPYVPMTDEKIYYGFSALEKSARNNLKLSCPISEDGWVQNLDDMREIWMEIFSKNLRVDPSERPILLATNELCGRGKQMIVQDMFEVFDVPYLFFNHPAAFSVFGTENGKTSGLVIQSGEGVTQVAPVYRGNVLPHAVQSSKILNGRTMTDYMANLCYKATGGSSSFISRARQEIISQVKEEHCYVALNYKRELDKWSDESHRKSFSSIWKLPCETDLVLGEEKFMCPEALFQPSLLGENVPGIHEMARTAVTKCDKEIQSLLFDNIILSGGNTQFSGFARRMEWELWSCDAKVNASSDKNLAFAGASSLASSPYFQTLVISKKEYAEVGPKVAERCDFIL